MKRSFIFIAALITIVICLFHCSAFAAIPKVINYQGMITDAGGVALTGNYAFHFALYDVSEEGEILWEEEQNLKITDGIFF